ncbi:MAG: hypothetical protein F4205_03735 [Gemmatimonadetes bacterium]|nr:hypothetical protein [Gemmatimonadota bacterium]MXX72795.1 hypothetical protein [Gemmatimonadota bacterium]MYC91828.1 hypothetical protein [Gemmatimonadota bacterium]MYG34584.1 hypothetical protein [Gemmatimonadota bacterium]
MPQQTYGSFEEWGRQERDRRLQAATERTPVAGGAAGGRLRVGAELAANAAPSAVQECRTIAVDWLQQVLGRRLPRKAWRHRPFSVRTDHVAIRAVRLRDRIRDHWAAQVSRTPGPDREVVTEVMIGRTGVAAPSVGVTVHDRSVVPLESVQDYPAEMLVSMAEAVPLVQGGRRLAHAPIVVDSDVAMNTFLKMLVDPVREVPFAVISVPPDDDDREARQLLWTSLARSLTGLALTWVLPSGMTFRLSDTVGKSLSVFLGAWRFYRPGFRPGADRSDHPLILGNRLVGERAVAEASRVFLRMAVEERMRAGSDEEGTPDYAAIATESASASSGPARLVSFLRSSILDIAAPRSQVSYPGSKSPTDSPSPAVVREPPPASPGARAGMPSARETLAGETPALRRKLRAARETARVRTTRYEQARKRAERAERERDDALRRAEQLAGLVRAMGGNPDTAVPFPTAWDEFAAWCDEHLAGRLALTGSARHELNGAEFADVGVAARCLRWLAGEYRDGRLQGGNPGLHGRIDDGETGVYNVPCGGDAFECSWDGRTHTVDWHIKRGANTRDPRRCLRIYYFWDEQTRQVVVASMPAHRKSSFS